MVDEHHKVETDILFQLDAIALQMKHERKVALYSSYFSAGASFEVFSLTLAITGLLLEKGLPFYWVILIFVYFFTGAGFITFAELGFGKLRKTEKLRIDELRKRFSLHNEQS